MMIAKDQSYVLFAIYKFIWNVTVLVQIIIFCTVVITTFTVVNSSKYVFQFTSINNCQLFKSFNDMEYSNNNSSESISISETTKTPYSSIYYFFNDLIKMIIASLLLIQKVVREIIFQTLAYVQIMLIRISSHPIKFCIWLHF